MVSFNTSMAARNNFRRRLCVSRIGAPTLSTLQPPTGSDVTFSSSQGIPFDPHANWSDIEITLGNFGNNFDDGPNAVTFRLGYEYPPTPSGICNPIFGPNGSRDITLEPGAIVKLRIPISVKGGDFLNLRYFGTVPAAGKWVKHERIIYYASPGNRYETPSTDKTLSGSISGTTANDTVLAYVMSITGIPDRGTIFPTVALLTDSIGIGAGESTSTVEQGFLVRALQNDYAWVHLGQSGGSYSQLWSTTGLQQMRMRRRSVMLEGVTNMFSNDGTNDIGTAQNNTGEATIAFMDAQAAECRRRGIVFTPMTLGPRTDAGNTGGFYGTDTQTQRDRIDVVNTYVRTNPYGWGFYDYALSVCDPNNRYKWRSDLGTPTADGLHPNPPLHAAAAADLKVVLPTLLMPHLVN